MITIRRAITADAAPLSAFADRTFRATFGWANTSANLDLHCAEAYGPRQQAAEISDASYVTMLAELDKRLVGFAQIGWQHPPPCVVGEYPGEIRRLYVDQDHHGRGVAQALVGACVAEMIAHESDFIWLGVWERNPRAIAFYDKCGFTAVGEHVFTLGSDPQRDVVMVRPTLLT